MKKALKQLWVEALESGNFPQGTGSMNYDGKFCCLGVLCEVAGLPKQQVPGNNSFGYHEYGEDPTDPYAPVGATAVPPVLFWGEQGMNYEDAMRFYGMNDKLKMTFPEIAQWIRENVKEED